MQKEQPIPQGKYLPSVRHGDIIYTSGMTPRKAGILQFSGQIKVNDEIEKHKEAVRLATQNALTAALACVKENERISFILQLNVFLNSEPEFKLHAKVADFASEVLIEELGVNCVGTRAAIGVASLPSNAPVEVTLTASVVAE